MNRHRRARTWTSKVLTGLTMLFLCLAPTQSHAQAPSDSAKRETAQKLFSRDNLVAWCIVPFDASKRTPQQRSEMVRDLGLSRVAYDWRSEHVPSFEDEILQYKKHGIEFFAIARNCQRVICRCPS